MAGNTKTLRLRIKSVTSTLQLTKAMGLVASSKVRRANISMIKAREYREALSKSVSVLTADNESQKSPYLRKNETGITKLIVIAGDRGMAGGYNANVFRLAATFKDADIIPIGKRACERYTKDFYSSEKFTFADANKICDKLCDEFCEGKFDRLGIIYTKYVSAMSVEADVKWILPLERGESTATGVIFEPDRLTVLNNAVKEYVSGMLTSLIRESFACEVTARRMAMDSAGKNAKQMIDELHLEYNRARQGAITQEITEIVAGSGQ